MYRGVRTVGTEGANMGFCLSKNYPTSLSQRHEHSYVHSHCFHFCDSDAKLESVFHTLSFRWKEFQGPLVGTYTDAPDILL